MEDIRNDSFVTAPAETDIPIIDLGVLAGGPSVRSELISRLTLASETTGAFYVRSPHVPERLLEEVAGLAVDYFGLSLAEKMRLSIKDSPNHRGYFPVMEENAKGSQIKDAKEGFDLALDVEPGDPAIELDSSLYGPNVYPNNPERFRNVVNRFYESLMLTARELCELFAEAIGEQPSFFKTMFQKPLTQLRILHYPAADIANGGPILGAGEHTDYGILTLLWQDQTGGLEIRTPKGGMFAVRPLPGLLFCNIGDMMQRITNNSWTATAHRVVNRSLSSRYSAAFFYDPDYEAVISPLPRFTSDGIKPAYEPITMGAYLKQGFDTTFTYRNSDVSTTSGGTAQ